MSSKPMTNYNERLDEILDIFHNKMLALETITNPCDEPGDEIDCTFTEAKQALTSLIKELVAEAKPEKHIHHDAYGKPFEDAQDIAYNAAIDQFEQNLLKALEEV